MDRRGIRGGKHCRRWLEAFVSVDFSKPKRIACLEKIASENIDVEEDPLAGRKFITFYASVLKNAALCAVKN